tara:strand:- start:375 stop:611 length:237 start_codon:yes stop_codon:yes gene_type:complete
MSKKRKKSKNYDITGIVEVINITPGHRKATQINFDDPPSTENTEFSGSIVIKRAIYETHVTENSSNEEISPNRSSNEG